VVFLLLSGRETTFSRVFAISLPFICRETTLRRANWQKVGTSLREFPKSSTKFLTPRRRIPVFWRGTADFSTFRCLFTGFWRGTAGISSFRRHLTGFWRRSVGFSSFRRLFTGFWRGTAGFSTFRRRFWHFWRRGPAGRAYPHYFEGGYVQKWPKTHIPSLIWSRVCTGKGEIIRLIYRGCAGAGGDARRVKKVGTILSKFVPEVARGSACLASCLSARDLSRPFEKIVPDF